MLVNGVGLRVCRVGPAFGEALDRRRSRDPLRRNALARSIEWLYAREKPVQEQGFVIARLRFMGRFGRRRSRRRLGLVPVFVLASKLVLESAKLLEWSGDRLLLPCHRGSLALARSSANGGQNAQYSLKHAVFVLPVSVRKLGEILRVGDVFTG